MTRLAVVAVLVGVLQISHAAECSSATLSDAGNFNVTALLDTSQVEWGTP